MQKKFLNRLLISIVFGILFGLLCVWLASSSSPDIRGTPLMRSILFNRFLIGVVVGIVGIYTIHPIFGFKTFIFRGALFGAIVSIDIAIGIYMNTTITSAEQSFVFWLTILAGAIYGLVIDIVATKFGGQGKELLHKKQK
ncbi:hypothetical protein K9M48_05395 [Candidatus Gracilibacteria bacterium]|nr:hypothetical protein [Candidatus Gracilibacteria bacterium]